jgi:tetratricopeptide (TPR) repeat protein
LLVASSSIWFHLLLLNDYLAWLDKAATVGSGGQRNAAQKAQLALAIGIALLYARGPIHETWRALSEGLDLASDMNNNAVQQRALWGLCSYHHLNGDYRQALDYANQLGESARHAGNQFAKLTYHRIAAASSHLMGDHTAAREHIVRALAPHYVRRNMPHGSVYQVDHLSASLMQLARILWIQGHPDQAMRTIEDALAQAEKTNQVLSVIYVLLFGACPIAFWAGEIDLAHEYVLKLEVCTTDKALPFCREWARKYSQTLMLMEESSESVDAIPIALDVEEPLVCDSLTDMLATMDIRFVGERAIDRANAGENGWCAPEIFRAQGERPLKRENRRAAETDAQAEQLFTRSLALAKEQGANFWILRTSLSYAGLLAARGQIQTARQVLGDALARFSEGRGVQLLLEATAFLNRLHD